MPAAPQIYRSHAGIAPFRLHLPKTVGEAAATRARAGARGAVLAGGVDLVPALRGGVNASQDIALGGIAALSAIKRGRGVVRIGGGVTYRQLETDPAVADLLPGLPEILGGVANIRGRRPDRPRRRGLRPSFASMRLARHQWRREPRRPRGPLKRDR